MYDDTKIDNAPNDPKGRLTATEFNAFVSDFKAAVSSLLSHLSSFHISNSDTRLSDARTPVSHVHIPGDVTQDTSNRFVTDAEKSTWNGKQSPATTLEGYGITDAEAKNENIQAHISSTDNPHTVTKTQIGLSNVDDVQQMPASYLDPDATFAANSDTKVPSQKAVKTASANWVPRLGQFYEPLHLYLSNGTIKSTRSFGGQHLQASAANGDYYIYGVFCAGIETILDFSWYKTNASGIFDLYINGVLDSSGYDGYASSSTNALNSITLTQTVISGWNEVKLKINGKNASSTNYYLIHYGMRLR